MERRYIFPDRTSHGYHFSNFLQTTLFHECIQAHWHTPATTKTFYKPLFYHTKYQKFMGKPPGRLLPRGQQAQHFIQGALADALAVGHYPDFRLLERHQLVEVECCKKG